jgi:hypothetical protein
MESEGGVAPRLLRDIRAGVASGRFLEAEPRLARAAVSGAVLATLHMALTNPELVDDAACDQLVEQLLRMLGVPFDAARELAQAPLPVAELPEPTQPRGGHTARRTLRDTRRTASVDDLPGPLGDPTGSGLPSTPTVQARAGTPPACRSRTCSRRRLGSQSPTGTAPIRPKTRARGLGEEGRVASAYVTAVRTIAASRCRRIAWHEVAGSTPRL